MPVLTADAVVGLLAEPDRLAVLAAVVLGAREPAELAQRTGLAVPAAVRAHQKLRTAGLLAVDGTVDTAALRALASTRPSSGADDDGPDELRAFLRAGRVTGFPAQPGRRRRLLEHVVAAFEPDRDYREPEVNAVLETRLDGPDRATLRRYLVDARLLVRADGIYRRAQLGSLP